jgi:hypothetical protein
MLPLRPPLLLSLLSAIIPLTLANQQDESVDPNTAGASGNSSDSVNLSTGATVAIIVIVSIVVILGGQCKGVAKSINSKVCAISTNITSSQ